MRSTHRLRRPITPAASQSFFFAVFSRLRHGPSRLPYQRITPAVTNHQHYSNYASCIVSTFVPCAPTAPPIYHFAHAEQRHVNLVHLHPASPVLYCTHARTHIPKSLAHDSKPMPSAIYDTPCIDCRPAQPATLSVGTRQLLRAFSSTCIAKRAPEFAPDSLRPVGSRDQSQKSNRRCAQAAGLHRHFVLLDFATRRSLAGPASVIKPTQQRKLNKTLNVQSARSLGRRGIVPPCVSNLSGFQARLCADTWF
jgi:hypothetical protein